MSKFLSAFFLLSGLAFVLPQAAAQAESAPVKKVVKKKVVKKKVTKKQAATKKADPAAEKEDEKVNIAGMNSTHYSCEMGDKVTIHSKPSDDKQITLSWHNRLHNLFRVGTTTGANRYEGPKSGLVWIGIPAKGMLLDAHRGKQLANECKNAQQLKHST